MNLNELIAKCKNKIAYEEREMQNGHLSFDHMRIIMNMQDMMSDLEELKEKIMYPGDYYVDNDNCCYIRIEEIIGE